MGEEKGRDSARKKREREKERERERERDKERENEEKRRKRVQTVGKGLRNPEAGVEKTEVGEARRRRGRVMRIQEGLS